MTTERYKRVNSRERGDSKVPAFDNKKTHHGRPKPCPNPKCGKRSTIHHVWDGATMIWRCAACGTVLPDYGIPKARNAGN